MTNQQLFYFFKDIGIIGTTGLVFTIIFSVLFINSFLTLRHIALMEIQGIKSNPIQISEIINTGWIYFISMIISSIAFIGSITYINSIRIAEIRSRA